MEIGHHSGDDVVIVQLYVKGVSLFVDGNINDCSFFVLVVVEDEYLSVAFV